jgi:hypothetical protein
MNTQTLDIPLFISRLNKAVAWTAKLSQGFDYENGWYGTVFRQTNPIIQQAPLYQFDDDYTTWNLDAYDIQIFEQALQATLAVRDNEPIGIDLTVSVLSELGRIICFTTQLTTHEGTAIIDSQCFVDDSDVPPIDTWFYLETGFPWKKSTTLFCWIPRQFESVMQAAIDVEMFGSYEWFDESTPAFYQKFLAALSQADNHS